MNDLIHHILGLVEPQFRLDLDHGIHGKPHWSRVWTNARMLCNEMQLDPTVPCAFSFLHDSQRFDDGIDIDHGDRAVEWILKLYRSGQLPHLTLPQLDLLIEAIAGHSHGQTDAHPIVQVCWDSDRLDLGRVGTIPDPQYLCTEVAKRPEVIQQALRRSLIQSRW